MWFAYHIRVSVPAYRTVSCSENPTFSFARTSRRLRQVGASTSRSVPVISSSVRTIIGPLLPVGLRVDRGGSDEDRVDRVGQDLQAFGEFGGGGGEGRQ